MRRPGGPRRVFQFPFRNRDRVARELDDEFAFHLDMRVAELIARGVAPDDARREALRRFGDRHDAREYCRHMDEHVLRAGHRRDIVSEVAQDMRWSLRQIARYPGFAVVAVLTLALGIGATVAIFSTINRVLFNPLPFDGGDRVVSLSRRLPNGGFYLTPTPRNIDDWRARVSEFGMIGAVWERTQVLGDSADGVTVDVGHLDPAAARILRLKPLAGRAFYDDDAAANAAPVAMIGEGLWKRRFGSDPGVIGSSIRLDGKTYTVIGIAPSEFVVPYFASAPKSSEVWTPLIIDASVRSVGAVALLRTGGDARRAEQQMAAVLADDPDRAPGAAALDAVAQHPRDAVPGRTQNMLYVLFGAVAVVLLIACSNVANLMLARAAGRQREMAVRSALGAGRGRLIRQLLTESSVLAATGGILGLVFAHVGLRAIIALRPDTLSELHRVQLDAGVAGSAVALAIVTGLLFGLAPALFATPRRAADSLRAGTRTVTSSGLANRVRAGLIVGEVALSVALLIGAGLLVRSLRALQAVDVGFNTAGITAVQIHPPSAPAASGTTKGVRAPRERPDPAVVHALMQDMAQRVRTLPGIESATLTLGLPAQMGVSYGALEVEGVPADRTKDITLFSGNWIEPGYFSQLGLPFVAGRVFDNRDRQEIVINESMAKRLWPNESAVGKRIRFGERDWKSVVGVVGDVRLPGAKSAAALLQVHMPFTGDFGQGSLLVRVGPDAGNLVANVTEAIQSVDSRWSVGSIETMDASVAQLFTAPRFSMTLLGVFAFIAAALAIVGLYGVIAYTVSQRTREMGIRIALGATQANVRALVMAYGARLAVGGIVLGLVAAFAATRLLQAQLYEVNPLDPLTFLAVVAGIVVVALAATYVPARRATRADPMAAVRAE